jgi:hypothetical protein
LKAAADLTAAAMGGAHHEEEMMAAASLLCSPQSLTPPLPFLLSLSLDFVTHWHTVCSSLGFMGTVRHGSRVKKPTCFSKIVENQWNQTDSLFTISKFQKKIKIRKIYVQKLDRILRLLVEKFL